MSFAPYCSYVDLCCAGIRTISHPFKLTDLEKILYAIT